jgi:membrane-associated phospholipid phosphatase
MAPVLTLRVRLARLWRRGAGRLPAGPLDVARQLLLFGGAYYVYRIVRGLVDGHPAIAFEHARMLVSLERGLHLFFEPGLQSWATAQAGWAVTAANWMYVNSHFVITTTFLIWLYLARNHAYYFVRNMFMIAMGLALVGYVAFPTAPPRFLPEWGFTDTVANFVGPAAERGAAVLYNPYAAVPSMHVAFALMVAIPARMLVSSRVLKALWSVYPLVVTFVVVVTGNHYWIDAALGAMVAAVSAVGARAALARARPEAWAWRTAKASA